MNKPIIIEASLDAVLICGARLDRPKHIPRSMWILFWERVMRIKQTGIYQ